MTTQSGSTPHFAAMARCKGAKPYILSPLISIRSSETFSSRRGKGATPLVARLKRALLCIFAQCM